MKTLVYSLFIICCLACTSAKTVSTTSVEDLSFERIIKNGPFEIESNWAQPQVTAAFSQLSGTGLIPLGSNVGNIDIIGNSNTFQLKDSIVKAYLPFFGERRQGSSYRSDKIGIEFEGTPQDLKTNVGKKNSYEIRFNINDKYTRSENYMVYVQIFPNLSSSINISSSHRTNIRFRGKAKILENDKN